MNPSNEGPGNTFRIANCMGKGYGLTLPKEKNKPRLRKGWKTQDVGWFLIYSQENKLQIS